MTRKNTWPQDLAAFLLWCSTQKFEYGVLDCMMFADRALEAVTGERKYESYQGTYDLAIGGVELLKDERRTIDLVEIMSGDHGLIKRNMSRCTRGDLVALEIDDDTSFAHAIGICDGANSLFMSPETGLTSIPTKDCVGFWSVD